MARHNLHATDEGDPYRDAIAVYGRVTDFVMPLPTPGMTGRHAIPEQRRKGTTDDHDASASLATDAGRAGGPVVAPGDDDKPTAMSNGVRRRRVCLACHRCGTCVDALTEAEFP